MAMIHSVFSI
jgi:hypothetical protein